MAIRKKYAGRDDAPTRQKMTNEINELYQKEGYNPMSGCLPMLIQLPILFALYYIVLDPMGYVCGFSDETIQAIINVAKSFPQYADRTFVAERNIDLLGVIKEVGPEAFAHIPGFSAEGLPNLTLFGGAINLGDTPSFTNFNWLMLVPVLTFLVYFGSMKLNRKLTYQPVTDPSVGCSNKIMDLVMPLFSVYITFVVPAAVGVYWIFKSIIGIVKQWILKKAMPIPVFTDEDYKAAEREMTARVDTKTSRAKSGRVVRSLHHIDDEDFEDTAERAKKFKEALAEQEARDAEARQQNAKRGLISGASLKKDDRKDKKETEEKEETDSPKDPKNETNGDAK
jgi:YidC/Oxa1 family membrane protein insertase